MLGPTQRILPLHAVWRTQKTFETVPTIRLPAGVGEAGRSDACANPWTRHEAIRRHVIRVPRVRCGCRRAGMRPGGVIAGPDRRVGTAPVAEGVCGCGLEGMQVAGQPDRG